MADGGSEMRSAHLGGFAFRDPRAGALADSLDACARGPCGSGGCPVCGEALQRDFAAGLDEFVGARRRGASVVYVSVALPGLAVPRGGLTGLNLPAAKRRVQARLSRAGVGWAIGSVAGKV